jgi:hypothetical protein
MIKILAISLMSYFLFGCTDNVNAKRILEENGYTNIQFTGYAFFACSKDDTYHTGFTAISPSGKFVSGTVCAGLFFKNSTIRFD